MKYLTALKEEYPLNEELEKPKNTYPDELQKVQKPLFTVFTVREGGTFQKKTEQEKIKNKPIRVQGYGCGCGHNLYHQLEDFVEEPADDNWEHQYRLSKVWQCENCKAIYEIIGGTRGPQFIN
jgi:hypothetical protein